jgi:anaerobic selenocysteine-containing dehydrogenase
MFPSFGSPEDIAALTQLAKKWEIDLTAPNVAGEQATFASIEAASKRVAQAVFQHVCQDLAAKQVALLQGPQPCPTCGTRCPTEVRRRTLNTGECPVEIDEVVGHCHEPGCRRDFFPSASPARSASARL